MNAPLSHIGPSQISRIAVLDGMMPLSTGGDSIGGNITAKSAAPVFADMDDGLRTNGGAWTNQIETKVVPRKNRVDARYLEPETAGYATLKARTS